MKTEKTNFCVEGSLQNKYLTKDIVETTEQQSKEENRHTTTVSKSSKTLNSLENCYLILTEGLTLLIPVNTEITKTRGILWASEISFQ